MSTHHGSCHCGAIEVDYESAVAPADAAVLACQCSFCRKHRTRAIADPAGRATIRVRDGAQLNRYRFGEKTTDFLLCRQCGVYVAACIEADDGPRALLIVNAFDDHDSYTRPPESRTYDGESAADRTARRIRTWTPATVVIDG